MSSKNSISITFKPETKYALQKFAEEQRFKTGGEMILRAFWEKVTKHNWGLRIEELEKEYNNEKKRKTENT